MLLRSRKLCPYWVGYAFHKSNRLLPGDYLMTSVAIGDPPQYFDLFLDVLDDKLVIVDQSSADPDLDYQYNYIKNLFVPE
jgi:hypothetical protein